MSVLLKATEKVLQDTSFEGGVDPFYGFEPWNVSLRPQWVLDLGQTYHVALEPGPCLFQSGALYSNRRVTLTIGGNQIGKSQPAKVEAVALASGELPISLRHPKGHSTGILRDISGKGRHGPLNRRNTILRFGRRDFEGGIIDYDPDVPNDPSWNCGFIEGAGVYPTGKLGYGAKVWICTFAQAFEEMWWPWVKENIPKHLLDPRKGVDGFNETKKKVYFLSEGEITFITYEQGYERVEAVEVDKCYLDEEPPDRRFYTGLLEHSRSMSIQYTPINGLSWSHEDLYLPALEGNVKEIEVFHATQFDCPFRNPDTDRDTISLLKPWEVAAKKFGSYSDQAGKPYFHRDRINEARAAYIPKHKLAKITVYGDLERPRDLPGSPTVLEISREPDQYTWQVYEEKRDGVAYWISGDTAMGEEDPTTAIDWSCAYVFRLPVEPEMHPVMVASIRTGAKAIPFARTVLSAAVYYNNAWLMLETKSESGAVIQSTLQEWPFWLYMITTNQATRKQQKTTGFMTTFKSRKQALDLVGDYIDGQQNLDFKHLHLMKELGEAVVGKNGRCDHPRSGSLDCVMAYAIGLWAFEYAREQITDNSSYSQQPEVDKFVSRGQIPTESRPVLGSKRGLDSRRTTSRRRKSQKVYRIQT